MNATQLLVPESLQETLWRLEEARQGFRSKSDSDVQKALNWVLSRQGLSGSYCNLFAPTERDLVQGLQLPTGERIRSKVAVRHIIGEETLRTTIVWRRENSPSVKEALGGFNEILDRGARETGEYCCYNCTIAFLRTLSSVKPKGWSQTLEKGIDGIRRARTSTGRWRGFPFYYTLLALSEMDTSSAKAELRYAGRTASKLVKRYAGNDRTSQFRRLALQATLNMA